MRAQADLRAAQQEVRRVEMSLRQRLASAFQDYANARQQVQRYQQEILPDAKESLGLIQQGYRQAEFGYLELLTAQRTYFRVNLNYVTALRDLWISDTRIQGMLLSGALQAPGNSVGSGEATGRRSSGVLPCSVTRIERGPASGSQTYPFRQRTTCAMCGQRERHPYPNPPSASSLMVLRSNRCLPAAIRRRTVRHRRQTAKTWPGGPEIPSVCW